jgi:thioredoxin reductase (NADPH)
VHRRDRLRASKIAQERASSSNKLEFIMNSVAERIEGEGSVRALHIKDIDTGKRSVLDVKGVFIYVGYTPNTGFLEGQVVLDKDSYIITDKGMSTSLDGVYAVGDVRAGSLKQISTAVGDGATAAIMAGKYIEEKF